MIGSSLVRRLSSQAPFSLIFLALAASAWVLPATVEAGSIITYTWHDDDSEGTSGYLEVQASAQAAGSISMADVVGFTFHAPDTNYNYPFLSLSPDPVPISTLTAGFTSSSSEIISGNALATITLPIDSNYDIIGGDRWSSSGYDGQYSGVGHWIITGAAAVPEPSAAILLGLGLGLAIVTGARVVRVNGHEKGARQGKGM